MNDKRFMGYTILTLMGLALISHIVYGAIQGSEKGIAGAAFLIIIAIVWLFGLALRLIGSDKK